MTTTLNVILMPILMHLTLAMATYISIGKTTRKKQKTICNTAATEQQAYINMYHRKVDLTAKQ